MDGVNGCAADPENECCNRDTDLLIEWYDTNGDETIDVGEFFAYYNDVNNGTIVWPDPEPEPVEPHVEVFEACDTNGDDAIDSYEMNACWLLQCDVDCMMNPEDECCNRDTDLLIEWYDDNGNGTICVDEFLDFFNDANAGTIVWPDPEPEPQPDPLEDWEIAFGECDSD